jgi:pimeloyl-ACP methyl ester carboxylesterase
VAATTESAGAADRPVSVLAWMGYDAPDAITDPRIAQTALARRGGELLAADVNALTLTRHGPSHVTVIGHSYGATTVADAAAGHGMRADDVVLVGAPGTDLAHSAADFGLPAGGHVYVGAAATDPVTNLAGIPGRFPGTELPLGRAGLGADPAADGFGSTRFKSEFGGWSWEPWADHDRYFESGSESLFSIAAIASGQGDELQEHGMTAPHRESILGPWATRLGLPSWSVPLMDPELLRPATTGHHHPARGAGS